ncbi:MAG: hypothetical protein U0Y10_11270 [Spirosomataceae bacterium]
MRIYLFILLSWLSTLSGSLAQRPSSNAEKAEDQRILQLLAKAMPRNVEDWEVESGETKTEGTTGFYHSFDFQRKDVFEHSYQISYRLTKIPESIREKARKAITENVREYEYLENATLCQVEVLVNATKACNATYTPFKKINSDTGGQTFRDAAGKEYTYVFFGDKWTFTPSIDETETKKYCLKANPHNTFGTTVQSIEVIIHADGQVADQFMAQMDWKAIKSLLGTGTILEKLDRSVVEKPIPPIAGPNTVEFTVEMEDGTIRQVRMLSNEHSLRNCARLRNHNPNPNVTDAAHMDISLYDDKDANKGITISLPIIRTTGEVTATHDSDSDYLIMWRVNLSADEWLGAEQVNIQLTGWATIGDFIEGTFSGTATYKKGVNNFDSVLPKAKITNGKFRVRRIQDEY